MATLKILNMSEMVLEVEHNQVFLECKVKYGRHIYNFRVWCLANESIKVEATHRDSGDTYFVDRSWPDGYPARPESVGLGRVPAEQLGPRRRIRTKVQRWVEPLIEYIMGR